MSMFTSSTPLYVQLKDYILRFVENELAYDDQIPSEPQLMARYSGSRTTVRKAIDELVREGKLYKVQGKGTYVSRKKVVQGLSDLISCTYELRKLGFEPYYRLLLEKVIPANPSVASNLKLNSREPVFTTQRISIIEGEPFNFTKSYLPYKYVLGIGAYDFEKDSLYKVLEDTYKIQLIKSIRSVETVQCDEELSPKLKIPEGTAILKFEGRVTGKLASGEIVMIEYFRTYYRTDKVKFYVAQTAGCTDEALL